MADENVTFWKGASGTKYKFWVHELPCSFNQGQDGNYIFAKVVNGFWQAIYIGEGDLGERISDLHHQAKCINLKGATHVHVHTNGAEGTRRSEEKDLLAANSEAYQPTGCNVKHGG